MNRIAQRAVLASLLWVSISATAQYRGTNAQPNYDFARVISAQPIYETVEVKAVKCAAISA